MLYHGLMHNSYFGRFQPMFFKYVLLGTSSFAADITLVWCLTEYAELPYLWSVIFSFLLTTFYSYIVARKYIFHKSDRHIVLGALYFYCFALLALSVIASSMVVLVEYFHIHYILARILIATTEGIWNFSTNYFFTFKAHRFTDEIVDTHIHKKQ